VPLVLCLLGLSAWPALVSQRAFGGGRATAQFSAFEAETTMQQTKMLLVEGK
jgi:hypothetical protein